jgi:hypothetical protein
MTAFDRSKTSLVPFSPRVMLSATYTAVLITGVVVMYFWPRQHLAGYINANDMPLAFFAAFSISLIIQSYLSLRGGRGEMIQKDDYFQPEEDLPPVECRADFIPRGLVECVIHTALLVSPFVPLLILGAALSAMSLQAFTQALAVLVTASLLCRILGVTFYLAQGRRRILGYLASRCVMIGFVFGTLVFAPMINPLHILYGLQFDLHRTGNLVKHSGYVYSGGVALAIFSLALINHWLAGRRLKQETQR